MGKSEISTFVQILFGPFLPLLCLYLVKDDFRRIHFRFATRIQLERENCELFHVSLINNL
ncbi:hypothetical protein Fmac_013995 [Flemingia macrophylla]|uniref:Uncharacterized protein n=1 Tax=Flemingia macrophylla TaxID=520843 RepID=A0ABD1MAL0_9FABA